MESGTQITLLELHPHEDGNARIQCTTVVVSLANAPKYDTLSYVWGDPAHGTASITVNGQESHVTQNLHAALLRLRKQDVSSVLWIDQLCIDQNNVEEKTRQVQLMREIYSNCSLCYLWMGELPQDVSVDEARWVLAVLEYTGGWNEAKTGGGSVPPLPDILTHQHDGAGLWRALTSLLGEDESREERSWWTRIWTVQEAVLVRRAHFMWGPLSLPWAKIQHAQQSWVRGHHVHLPRPVLSLIRHPSAHWGYFMALVAWLTNTKRRAETPMHLFFKWRRRQASDPRDKVYALLGLCDPRALPKTAKCDYELPIGDVLINLTVELILHEKGLKPLVADLKPDVPMPGVPNWVYNVAHYSNYNMDMHHLFGYQHYDACSDRKLNFGTFQERMALEPGVLQIPGSRADVVAHVGELMVQDKRIEPDPSRYRQCIRKWYDLGKKQYRNKLTFWEDFCRTMIGDLVRNSEQQVERRATIDDLREVHEYFVHSRGRPLPSRTIQQNIANQTFFVTETGMIGLGHPGTRVGDEIWVLNGGRVPFTLRPRAVDAERRKEKAEKGGRGELGKDGQDESELEEVDLDFEARCYVHGLMSGQLIFGDAEPPPLKMVRMH